MALWCRPSPIQPIWKRQTGRTPSDEKSQKPRTFPRKPIWARLAERGIEYVFANAGTDFAPLIESLARNADGRRKFPRVITVPHENVAMAMAHGYYKIAGKPAAVMVHVTVGTGNAVNGIMNAARDNIPVLLAAGRTPITETGHTASRNRPIHWGQEAFDQGGMVREFIKWDYELRVRPAGRGDRRSRARHRHERAARPGLSDAAARSAVRRRDRAARPQRRPRRSAPWRRCRRATPSKRWRT